MPADRPPPEEAAGAPPELDAAKDHLGGHAQPLLKAQLHGHDALKPEGKSTSLTVFIPYDLLFKESASYPAKERCDVAVS
ncbi:hypothetical protein ABZP36_012654 [Zizania latifolia]